MKRRLACLLAAASAVLACAHQRELVPAQGAQTLPDQPRVAQASVDGVRVQVDASAWRARRVDEILSPVRVTIENGSDRPLRTSFALFTLGTASGFRLAALPPYQVLVTDAHARAVAAPPGYVGSGFLMTPWPAVTYRGFEPWYGPFPYDPVYYNRYYGAAPPSMPNEDILRRALPEGVLQPGGKVSGFVYFPEQAPGTQLDLYAHLVDGESGQSLGTAEIPFMVK